MFETVRNQFTEEKEKKYRWSYLIAAVLVLCNILFVNVLPNIRDINFDCPSMNLWTVISMNHGYFFVQLIVILLLLSGVLCIYYNKMEVLRIICVAVIVSAGLYSNQLVYKTLHIIKEIHAVTKSDALKVNEYMNAKTDNQSLENTFLLLEGDDASDYYLLECYLDVWYYRSFYQEYAAKAAESGSVDLSALNVHLLDRSYYTEDKQAYDYVLSIYPIDIAGYQAKDIGLQKYYLFEFCEDNKE